MSDEDVDLDKSLGRVCDEAALPAHVRQPAPTLQQQLADYGGMIEEVRERIIDPALRQQNDMAFLQALNKVLTGWGYNKRAGSVATEHPAPAPGPQLSGPLTMTTGSPLELLRRLWRRLRAR